jgi:hypothetical protein
MNLVSDLVQFKKGNGFVGLKNAAGEVIIPPDYGGFGHIFKNLIIAFKKGKAGLIDRENKVIYSFDYYGIHIIPTGFIRTLRKFEYDDEIITEIISIDGRKIEKSKNILDEIKILPKAKYSSLKKYNSGYELGKLVKNGIVKRVFLLKDNSNEFDLIEENGEFVDPLFLSSLDNPSISAWIYFWIEQNTYFSINGKQGLFDSFGRVVIPFIYDAVTFFINDLLLIKLNEKFGISDVSGRIFISAEFDEITLTPNLEILLNKGSEYFILEISDLNYEYFLRKVEYRFSAYFLDSPEFPRYSYGLRHQVLRNNVGKVFPYMFSQVTLIPDSIYCIVRLDELFGLIDEIGVFKICPSHLNMSYIEDNTLLIQFKNKEWGVIDFNGVLIRKYDLSDVSEFLLDKKYKNKEILLMYEKGLVNCCIKPFGDLELLGVISIDGLKLWEDLEKMKFYNYAEEDDFDEDYTSSSSNPWDDVFGPGEEADDARWNTSGE